MDLHERAISVCDCYKKWMNNHILKINIEQGHLWNWASFPVTALSTLDICATKERKSLLITAGFLSKKKKLSRR